MEVFKRCNLEEPVALISSVFKLHDGSVRASRRRSRVFGHVDDSVWFFSDRRSSPYAARNAPSLLSCLPACLPIPSSVPQLVGAFAPQRGGGSNRSYDTKADVSPVGLTFTIKCSPGTAL